MKIAQVTPYFHPHIGGVESHVRDLARKLLERGHEVDVITSAFDCSLPSGEIMDGVRIHRLPVRAIIAKTPIMKGMARLMTGRNYDVVHAHCPPPLADHQSGGFCHRNRVPFVLTYHCDMEIPIPGGKYIVALYAALFGRKTIRWSDAVICTTGSYAATSRSTWHMKVEVIPNAVDINEFHPDIDGSDIRERLGLGHRTMVLFVGRIVYHKGVETILRSAEHTSEDIHYVIVGEGNDRARLERMAREIDPLRFTFTGAVPREELPRYYAATDIFVLPSLSRLEAFGIVGLESMASGKPVILSTIPGVSEVITPGEEGVLFNSSSSTDLGRKIMHLHHHPEVRRMMGERGRTRVVRDYSMTAIARQVEEVYHRVLSGRETNGGEGRQYPEDRTAP